MTSGNPRTMPALKNGRGSIAILFTVRFFQFTFRHYWLIVELVRRDLRLRYRGSYLGMLWSVLNPVLFMSVYALIFGVFFHAGIAKYPVYLLSGLIPWVWFASSISQGITAISDGRMYVGKTIFPTQVLLIVPVISGLINLILSLPTLALLCVFWHTPIGWSIVMLPIAIMIEAAIIIGALLVLSTYAVFFRDLEHLVGLALTLVFYLVPIIYTTSLVPAAWRGTINANPLTPIVFAFQDLFYRGTWPAWWALGYSGLIGAVICCVGVIVFIRHRDAFAEYL